MKASWWNLVKKQEVSQTSFSMLNFARWAICFYRRMISIYIMGYREWIHFLPQVTSLTISFRTGECLTVISHPLFLSISPRLKWFWNSVQKDSRSNFRNAIVARQPRYFFLSRLFTGPYPSHHAMEIWLKAPWKRIKWSSKVWTNFKKNMIWKKQKHINYLMGKIL